MDKIEGISFSELKDSAYVKPLRMHFKQAGQTKSWDILGVHDSVSILLFNENSKCFVLVKQFRPAVYFHSIPVDARRGKIDTDKYPPSVAITVELCAGIVDKNKSLEEIACEEVLEECGYLVEPSHLEKITTCRSGVGVTGGVQTMYFCKVTDDMKVSDGGGNPGEQEMIEVIDIPVSEARSYLKADFVNSPAGLLFAFYWYFVNKCREIDVISSG